MLQIVVNVRLRTITLAMALHMLNHPLLVVVLGVITLAHSLTQGHGAL
jgi:hypothetical protein